MLAYANKFYHMRAIWLGYARICYPMAPLEHRGCNRPPQFQLAKAKNGMTGSGLQRAVVHDLQSHRGRSLIPTPAHVGGPCSVAAESEDAACRGTLRVFSSHLYSGWLGCCTEEACSSSVGICGQASMYLFTSSSSFIAWASST